jgi:hydroxymethylpyrimidine/phosphomethylpyrimidine kinase
MRIEPNKSPSRLHIALTIAGFDGSGGAGIQADLKTFSALGCYGASVLTALPIQNTTGIKSVYEIPQQCIEEQLHSILEDIEIDAIKIGMLHRPEVIDTLTDILKEYSCKKVVLDPVLMAKNGFPLLTVEAVDAMKKKLFPMITLLTPNLPEASALLQREVRTVDQMKQAAFDLANMGPQAIVIKGGHLEEEICKDCLVVRHPQPQTYWFSSPRVETKNTHGTGCTFSAAITAYLAKGLTIPEAVEKAKTYLSHCIEAGSQFKVGNGNGPLHHFSYLWNGCPF